jgi:transcriptional regulator with XRE-family HTH domain
MARRNLVGRNFARLRRDRGLIQEQIKEISDFGQQYISGVERGRRNPTVITLDKLSQALGVSPVELVQSDAEN